MIKVIRNNEGKKNVIADNKTAINLITKDISPGVSLAIIDATNYCEEEKTLYDRIYYVIDGKLGLTTDDNDQVLESGDSCFISKGTIYTMAGTFKLLVINQPAFGMAS
ncbi:MAG: hypothetical protein NTZ55_04620 [Candidatus Roizmanbacteria bacterium]|nr:hypothetical protein [Candidatus Roizmanbacteria bacterium]